MTATRPALGLFLGTALAMAACATSAPARKGLHLSDARAMEGKLKSAFGEA